MIKNNFFKNTSWIIVGQIIRMMVSLVVGVITARYLGPSNNGIITYVGSYIAFFVEITGLGLNGILIYEFVNHRDEEGKILGTAIFLRFIVGLISVILFLGIVILTDGNDKKIVMVAVIQALRLPFLCFDTITYWYQSNMKSKHSVIAHITAYLVVVIYRVYLLLRGKSVIWFAFATTLDFILVAFLLLYSYQKNKTQKLGYSSKIAKRLLKNCIPFILANIMVVIYGQIDRIMIKQIMNSTREVGLYSAAITICGLISLIPSAILESGRPIIAEAKKVSDEKFRLRFRQILAMIIWVCVLYSIFITFFSKIIIYLMYGNEYSSANVCLKIAVWYTSFSYMGSARNFWLICEDKKKYVFIFSCLGAVCNVVMNITFIPIWGINGAAIATLITQILANLIIPITFKNTRSYSKEVVNAVFFKNIHFKEMISVFLKR